MKNTCTLILFFAFVLPLKAQVPDKSWWTFSYPEGRSLDSGVLNLRYLNERFAGQNGFIKLSTAGNSFVNGKGKEIRFWATNGGSLAQNFDDKKLDSLARFLAKMGVNMVRYHGSISPKGKNTKLTDVDTTEARNIWRCVAAMKKQGIYTVISPFWPHNGHMGGWIPKEWDIEGYAGKDEMWEVLFFNNKLKDAYKAWVKYLYTTPNPYTKVALRDEPAVAIIQVENEDSPLFWTMNGVKPSLKKMVGAQFSKWLQKKYPQANYKDTVDLINIYDFTIPPRSAEHNKQVRDQLQFYAENQRDFYDDMLHYYRDVLGCKQLINGNNWRTASQSRLLDIERWTNSGAEVIAVNKYFDPQHKGPNSGWRIDPGDFYGAPSALKNPADMPTNIKHVAGRPMVVTESGWNLPNRYQTEGALLVAAYGGLTGLDAFFWFNPTATNYMRQPHLDFLNIKGQHPLNRWTTSTPGEMGMFPANALIQRLGYVKEANAVSEQRSMKSMLNRDIPPIFEEQSFDPNRDFVMTQNNDQGKLSPLTFLTGGVVSTYDTKTDGFTVAKGADKLIDVKAGTVSSVTGQQKLNYKDGIFILNTPYAVAVSGFLNTKKVFDLGDVIIRSDNEYATIEVVSIDGKPLSQSNKILLQVGTIFRPTGWAEEPATITEGKQEIKGFRITNTGKMPWLGMPAQGSILFKNRKISKATLLDAAGYPLRSLSVGADGSLKLPADAFYIMIQ
ncbi:MAG: hypothetical protein V4619_01880 [Bacteroidota bacterium]